MKNSVETLRAARDKISDAKHWTVRDYAKDGNGRAIAPTSPDAECWCAFGAVMAVADTFFARCDADRALAEAVRTLAPDARGVTDYNDTRKHRDVLRLFDTAIALVEAR